MYLFSTESDKRKVVATRLEQIKQPVWSTQIIQELYQVLTSKYGQNPEKVKGVIHRFYHFETVTNDLNTIEKAIDLQIINEISFWDSLVLSAASQARCTVVLTEDLNHHQVIAGVKVVNPFF